MREVCTLERGVYIRERGVCELERSMQTRERHVTVDVLRKQQTEAIEMAIEESESENNSSDVNSDSEGELIVEELESDSDISVGAEESGQAEDVEPLPWVVTTRYGRHAGHWNLFQLE